MSYMHIDNLYKNQEILAYKECYAMEKIHGTSARISYKDGRLSFFAGGCNHEKFIALFDVDYLATELAKRCASNVSTSIHGEAYGGKIQHMSNTYGKELEFVGFEVNIAGLWLNVPKAEAFVRSLGLDFVSYNKIVTTLEAIDAERDACSVQAVKCGMGEGLPREGIVLRPLEEYTTNNGARVIAKHKGDNFKETKSPRKVQSLEELRVLVDAKAIAIEWVTHERLLHVSDSTGLVLQAENIGKLISAMHEDIEREGKGEIATSVRAKKEIGKSTALLIKQIAKGKLSEGGKR